MALYTSAKARASIRRSLFLWWQKNRSIEAWIDLQGALCPSWPGGVAARSREAAQPPKPRRRGGCSNTADLTLNHHPVCGVTELSRLVLDAAATPPGQEGQTAPLWIRSHLHRPRLQ